MLMLGGIRLIGLIRADGLFRDTSTYNNILKSTPGATVAATSLLSSPAAPAVVLGGLTAGAAYAAAQGDDLSYGNGVTEGDVANSEKNDRLNPTAKGSIGECNDDRCKELIEQIRMAMKALNRRYLGQCKDKKGLWVEHLGAYHGSKEHLNKLVKEAERLGCDIPQKAYDWLTTDCPRPGTPFNTSPGYFF
jgi:hypothetical protein